MSKLIIPKNKQIPGLFVFCNRCNKKSKSFLVADAKCKHPEDQVVFRAVITIPGTKSIRSKQLKTKDLGEAIKQTIDFKKELEVSDYKQVDKTEVQDKKPLDLIGCIVMYLDFLENKNVHGHQVKVRSKAHIDQIKTYLKRFVIALKEHRISVKGLLVRNIDNKHAGIFHDYLLKKYPESSNRTYNRHMDTVSEFFNYLIDVKHYALVNYFSSKNVVRKRVHTQIETISMKEFKELLGIIREENGKEVLSTGENKYHYYDWLSDAFEFALYSGRRRDEIMNVRFNDIVEADGKPRYIVIEDYKYNRRNNLVRKEEKKYNYTPIIYDLLLFLQKIGYDRYKGTDRYLIAPESDRKRETLKDDMSKAFSHFYKILNTGRELEFKNLRKTYITLLNNHTNGQAEIITGQSGQQLIMNNYHDRKVFDDVILNFRMIS